MTARAAVHKLIDEDTELTELGVGATYAANTVDTPGEELFVIIKWDPTTAAFGSVGSERVQIWVHDRQPDYGRISKALSRIQDLLTDAVHLAGEDDWTLTLADWNGQGPDLFDGGYSTVTRYADFTTVSRYTPS